MQLPRIATLTLLTLLVVVTTVAAQEIKILDSSGVARAVKRGSESAPVTVNFATTVQGATLVRDDGRSVGGQANGSSVSFSGVSSGNWQIVSQPSGVAIRTVQVGR